jgi:uncharacterized protein (TIGR02300 family)
MALAAMPPALYLTGSDGRVRKRANHHISGGLSVAKAELGTKRVCPTTGRKFYDLNKDPIISPYTGMVVPVAPVVTRGRAAEKAAVVPVATEEVAAEEEVEVISLDEADEEEATTGKKDAADDIDVVDEEIPDADDDADTFLEEDEDDEVDAAELIDGELPGEEEA